MASTPSASALTSVLRCRGNIWTRNPPTKRPPTTASSLGLAGGSVRDSPAERSRSHYEPTSEAFLQGQRVVVGRRLAVEYKSSRVGGKISREKSSKEKNNLYYPKLSQSRAYVTHDAHSAAQNALVRQLALKLISNLPATDICSQIIQSIKYEKYAAHICKIVFVQETNEFPTGSLKVSINSSYLMDDSRQIASFSLPGWSTLKSTCLSLTALVSEMMFCQLAVLCRSSISPDDASQQDVKNGALRANEQTQSPTDFHSSKDRPD
ncbi:hypothetical protein PAMP_002735 [Pampus punctatissimus]